MRRLLFAISIAVQCALAAAQDYEREKRWAAEVDANLVVGDAVRIGAPPLPPFLGLDTAGATAKPAVAAGAAEKPAVLLVHGTGVHPDHGVIGILRMALADMGYRTLSIQMPVLPADAQASDYYPALFPDAAARIRAAANWLRDKGERRIVLLSHSLGAWMSQAYLESADASAFAAWISLGRSGPLGAPKIPVLDVQGEKDLPAVRASAAERLRALERVPGSRQLTIAGADHFYTGREQALARVVNAFMEGLP
jgi:pimeloyl-ACP methyl ester carboxylesterase